MRIKKLKGQTALEYILLFTAVVLVLVVAFARSGFITRAIDRSVDESINGIGAMATEICFDRDGNPC
ncbi:MAG: class III signal peptide-containing protein [Candidatus Omnitrophica bacterium]|nr:class III signal peptide-containing protein [Candidatus Omnitrophota bacterium]